MPVYLRKLNKQELGYSGMTPGQRGRYLLISKDYAYFFPILNPLKLNDTILLSAVYAESQKETELKYVYHNSRYSEKRSGGRDELRIYLNRDIDPGSCYFMPEDIVIFEKVKKDSLIKYKLTKLSAEDHKYAYYLSIIKEHGRRGTHAVVDEELLK